MIIYGETDQRRERGELLVRDAVSFGDDRVADSGQHGTGGGKTLGDVLHSDASAQGDAIGQAAASKATIAALQGDRYCPVPQPPPASWPQPPPASGTWISMLSTSTSVFLSRLPVINWGKAMIMANSMI